MTRKFIQAYMQTSLSVYITDRLHFVSCSNHRHDIDCLSYGLTLTKHEVGVGRSFGAAVSGMRRLR